VEGWKSWEELETCLIHSCCLEYSAGHNNVGVRSIALLFMDTEQLSATLQYTDSLIGTDACRKYYIPMIETTLPLMP
jgi:hypothetical protein